MNELRERIEEYAINNDIHLLFADGFDEAILGVVETRDGPCVAYRVSSTIEILMNESEMSEEEALEYFEFNISGSFMGQNTPIWVDDFCI